MQFLKDCGKYAIEVEGIRYCNFYETPENGMIKVPQQLILGCCYIEIDIEPEVLDF